MTHEMAKNQVVEISITDLVKALLDKFIYIVIPAIVALVLAIVYVLFVTPTFESTVSILVRPMTNSTSIENMFSGASGSSASQISTEIELIKSENVLRAALSLLDLDQYQDKDGEKYSQKKITTKSLKDKITVSQSSNTRNVEITVADSSKEFATDYANALATAFRDLLSDLSKESSRAQILTIENQIPEAEAELTKSLNALAKFKTEFGTDQMVSKIAVLTEKIATIQMQKKPLELQLSETKTKLNNLDVTNFRVDSKIKESLAKYSQSVKERSLYEGVGEDLNSARLYTLESQINSANNEIRARLYALAKNAETAKYICDMMCVESRISVLEEIEGIYSEELAGYQIIQGRLQERTKEVEVNQQLVLSLKTMLEESKVVESAVQINVSIIDKAEVPNHPVKPQKTKIVCIATFVGALLGASLVTLAFLLDRSVKSEDDIRNILGDNIPLIGWIPYESKVNDEKDTKKRICALRECENYCAERYRLLASNLEYITQEKTKVIIVNSSDIGEGKTTVTLNLAATLATNKKKVLVIDGDLRRPELERAFNIKKCEKGLTSILLEKTPYEDCIVQPIEELPRLHFLPAGRLTKNTNMVFGSKGFTEIIKKFRTMYDFVFIDCPPLSFGSDFAIAAKSIDGFIFNIRAGFATKDQLIDFKNNIDLIPAPVIGYVFYAVLENLGTYGYSRGYKGYNYYGEKQKKHVKLDYRTIQKAELKKRMLVSKTYGSYDAPLAFETKTKTVKETK